MLIESIYTESNLIGRLLCTCENKKMSDLILDLFTTLYIA
jgi:hypothetical protein